MVHCKILSCLQAQALFYRFILGLSLSSLMTSFIITPPLQHFKTFYNFTKSQGVCVWIYIDPLHYKISKNGTKIWVRVRPPRAWKEGGEEQSSWECSGLQGQAMCRGGRGGGVVMEWEVERSKRRCRGVGWIMLALMNKTSTWMKGWCECIKATKEAEEETKRNGQMWKEREREEKWTIKGCFINRDVYCKGDEKNGKPAAGKETGGVKIQTVKDAQAWGIH